MILYNIHIAILLCLFFLCLIYPLSPHPAAMAKKKKNRPAAKRCSVHQWHRWSRAVQRHQSGAVAGQWPGEE